MRAGTQSKFWMAMFDLLSVSGFSFAENVFWRQSTATRLSKRCTILKFSCRQKHQRLLGNQSLRSKNKEQSAGFRRGQEFSCLIKMFKYFAQISFIETKTLNFRWFPLISILGRVQVVSGSPEGHAQVWFVFAKHTNPIADYRPTFFDSKFSSI